MPCCKGPMDLLYKMPEIAYELPENQMQAI